MLKTANNKIHLKIADSIFESAPIGILIVDSKGIVLNANKIALDLFAISLPEMIAHSVLEFMPKVEIFFPKAWWQKIFNRSISEIVTQVISKDGTKTPIKVQSKYNEDTDLQLLYITVITNQNNTNNEFIKPEDNLLAFFNSTSEIIAIISPSKIIVSFNKIFEHYVQLVFDKKVNIGDHIHHFRLPGTEFDFDKNFELAMLGKEVRFERELYYNKFSIWWSITYLPVRNSFDDIIGIAFVLQNIDDRKIVEESLLRSEERFKLVVEGSNDGWWDWDLVNNNLFYSPKWWNIMGYENNELVNIANYWEKLVHPNDLEHIKTVFKNTIESNNNFYEVEFNAKHKEGHFIPVLSKGFILRNSEGKAIRVSGSDINLSEHKKQAFILLENERKLKISQKLAQIGNYEIDLATLTWKGSDIIYQILGIKEIDINTVNQLLGFVHFQNLDQVTELYNNAITNKIPFNVEYKVLKMNSKEFCWVSDFADIDYDKSGNPLRIIGALQDITERKNIAGNLVKNEIKYRSLIENMDFGILEVDTNEVITKAYPKFCEMFGYSEEELIGKSAIKIFLPINQKEHFLKSTKERKFGISSAYEIQLYNKKKEVLDILISGTPLFNDQGEVAGSIGIHYNITNQKRIEMKVEKNNETFEKVLNLSPVPIIISEPSSGNILLVNQAMIKLLHKTKEELIGKEIALLFNHENEGKKLNKILEQQPLTNIEIFLTINGQIKPFNLLVEVIEMCGEKMYLNKITDLNASN